MKRIKLSWSVTDVPNIFTLRHAVATNNRTLAQRILKLRLGVDVGTAAVQCEAWSRLRRRVCGQRMSDREWDAYEVAHG